MTTILCGFLSYARNLNLLLKGQCWLRQTKFKCCDYLPRININWVFKQRQFTRIIQNLFKQKIIFMKAIRGGVKVLFKTQCIPPISLREIEIQNGNPSSFKELQLLWDFKTQFFSLFSIINSFHTISQFCRKNAKL